MHGRKGFRMIADAVRIKRYVGKHRQKTVSRGLKSLGIGGLVALGVGIALEFPWTIAFVVLAAMAASVPGANLS